MGQLYEERSRLDQLIRDRKLDQITVYGEIGLRAGFLVSLIRATTPDDDAKVEKLRTAVKDVLHVRL